MPSYQQLAYIYDQLMEAAPYTGWIDFVKRVSEQYGHRMHKIVDLACGTGTISTLLAEQGFDVTGIDQSEEMLMMAEYKARKSQVSIHWSQQDISQFIVPDQVDTIVCFCDSINYLTDAQLISQTFQSAYEQLVPGGLLLFDCHSIHKLEYGFANYFFGSNEEELSYIWQCEYDSEMYTVDHYLTFFVREQENYYHRFDEIHTQKAYSIEELCSRLGECGFEIKEISADFTTAEPTKESERLFFVAQKGIG